MKSVTGSGSCTLSKVDALVAVILSLILQLQHLLPLDVLPAVIPAPVMPEKTLFTIIWITRLSKCPSFFVSQSQRNFL